MQIFAKGRGEAKGAIVTKNSPLGPILSFSILQLMEQGAVDRALSKFKASIFATFTMSTYLCIINHNLNHTILVRRDPSRPPTKRSYWSSPLARPSWSTSSSSSGPWCRGPCSLASCSFASLSFGSTCALRKRCIWTSRPSWLSSSGSSCLLTT